MAESHIDVAAVVSEIEAEVAARRQRGEYPAALLEQLHTEISIEENHEPAEAYAVIASARPIYSNRPVLGRVIMFGKRAIRRTLAWYVHPIADDQTHFNIALLNDVRRLEKRVAALEAGTSESDRDRSG